MVTKYHKKHRDEIGIHPKIEAYIQSLILKKTLESISFDRSRGIEEEDGYKEIGDLVNKINGISEGMKPLNVQL